jgi:hypothetical protein
MRKFDAWGISILLRDVYEARAHAIKICNQGHRDASVSKEMLRDTVNPILASARAQAERAELHSTLDRVREPDGYFYCASSGLKPLSFQELSYELKVLQETIEADLQKRHFVFIPAEKAKLLEEVSVRWGNIWDHIPACKTDTEEALYCYCLGRETASVFHAIRVAEFGLRNIARKVGVRLTDKHKPQPIEYATWDKVITAIKNKHTAAHAMPKNAARNKKLQFFADAAENCIYIKDLWRNDISHTGKNYQEAEALGILNRVRDFMHLLVGGPR